MNGSISTNCRGAGGAGRGGGEGREEAGNPTPGPTEIILFNTLLLVRI